MLYEDITLKAEMLIAFENLQEINMKNKKKYAKNWPYFLESQNWSISSL